MRVDPAVVQAWLERTCAVQGVPVKVSDPRIVAKVAALLGQASGQTGSIRAASKVARPRTAGRMTARSRTEETIAR